MRTIMQNKYAVSIHKDKRKSPTLYRVDIWKPETETTMYCGEWVLYNEANKIALRLSKLSDTQIERLINTSKILIK